MANEKILTSKAGKIAHIIFNKPERHNAMSLDMWQRLADVMTELALDAEIRVVVLSGAGGKAFGSGADISQFDSERATAEGIANYERIAHQADAAVAEFPKPTIAKINGYCVGGGLGLALGCDIRLCSQDARFALPAAKLALGYSFEGVKKLIDAAGPANAAEIFYSARLFSADEALKMGLVNQVLPADELDTAVDDLAAIISNNAPLTQMAFKAAMKECAKPAAERDLARIRQMADACFASEDYKEGRRAFMEKRDPVFRGR